MKVVGLKIEVDGFPVIIKNVKQLDSLIDKLDKSLKGIGVNKLTQFTKATSAANKAQQKTNETLTDANGILKKNATSQGEVNKSVRETKKAIDSTDFGDEKLSKLKIQYASLKNAQKSFRDDNRKLQRELESTKVNNTSLRGLELQYTKLRSQIKLLSDEERKSKFGTDLIKRTAIIRGSITKLNAKLNDFGANVGNYRSGINRLGGSFKNLALTLGAGFGISEIGRALTGGVKLFAGFNQQLAILQSVSRSTKTELAPLREEILRLGETTQFTAKEAADAATILARAGQSNEQILQTLEPTLQGAIATGSTIEDLADITAKGLSSLGIPASEAGEFVAQFTATLNTSNNDLSTYRESLKEFAPTARSLKIPLEEVNATIGILGDNGLQGTVATTTLKTSLTRLSDESKKYAKAAKAAGVEVFNTNGEFVGMGQLIENLEKSVTGLTDKEKQATISRIFGNQAVNQFSALLNAQKDIIVDGEKVTLSGSAALKGYTEQLTNSSDAAKESAAIVGDTLSQDMLKFQSAVEGATIALVEGYNGGLRTFVQGLTELAPKLIRNIDLIAKIGLGILVIAKSSSIAAAAQKAWAIATAAVNVALGIYNGTITIATIKQRAFNVATKANPLGLLITALTAAYLAYETYGAFASEAARAQNEVNKAVNEAKVQFLQEKRTLESLFSVLEDDTASRKEKLKAIEALKQINPEYVKGIDAETTSTEILSAARARSLELLRKETFEKVKNQKLSALIAKEAEELVRIEDLERRGSDAFTGVETAISLADPLGILNSPLEAANQRLGSIRGEIQKIEEDFNNIINQPVKSKGRAAYIKQLNAEKKLLESIKEEEKEAEEASRGKSSSGSGGGNITDEIIETAKTGLAFYRAEISRLNEELESADGSEYLELSKTLVDNENKAKELQDRLDTIKKRLTENSTIQLEPIAPITGVSEVTGEGISDVRNTQDQSILDNKLEQERKYLELSKLQQLENDKEVLDLKFNNDDVEFKTRLALAKEIADKELAIVAEGERLKAEERKKNFEQLGSVLSGVQEGIGALAEIGDIRTTNQLNKVEETYAREIELAGENEEAKEAAEIKFENAKIKIEKEAFERNKKFAIGQAIINGALAATQALANTALPFPVSLTALIPIAIQTGLQVAAIKARKFDVGGMTGKGLNYRDETGQRVAGVVHENEYVAPTSQLKKYPALFRALEQDRRGFALGGFSSDNGINLAGLGRESLRSKGVSLAVKVDNSLSISEEDISRISQGVSEGAFGGTVEGTKEGAQEVSQINFDNQINQ